MKPERSFYSSYQPQMNMRRMLLAMTLSAPPAGPTTGRAMYAENDILFPHNAIPALRRLRGPEWQALIERVLAGTQLHDETLALMLLMIRLNGCAPCETDSYRAMRGCAACATQTLRRFKGSDDELLRLFDEALRDVRAFSQLHPRYGIEALPLTPRPHSV
jgi:hypothetical protein